MNNSLFKFLILIPLLSISLITYIELNKLTDLSKIDPLKELSEALTSVNSLNKQKEANRTEEKKEEKLELTKKDYVYLSIIDSIEEKLLSIEGDLLRKYESQLRNLLNSQLNQVNQPDEETVKSVVESLKERKERKEKEEDYKILNDYEELIGKAKGFNHEMYEYSEKANLYFNKLLNLDKILMRQTKENERILPFFDEVLFKNEELKKLLQKELSQIGSEGENLMNHTYKSVVSMLNITELNEKLIRSSDLLEKSIDLFVNTIKDKEKK